MKRGRSGFFWFVILRFFAANWMVSVTLLSPSPIIFLHLGLTLPYKQWLWFLCAFLSYVFLIIAAIAPRQYATITLLDTILPSIHKTLKLKENDDRITIHYLQSRKKEKYVQLTNYFPTKTGAGRVFSIRKGVVGRCFTRKTALATSLPKNRSPVEVLPGEWGYTNDEVGYLKQDRHSYFAFPIGEESDFARAVLYMDSSDPDRFTSTNESEITQKIETFFLPILKQIFKKIGIYEKGD